MSCADVPRSSLRCWESWGLGGPPGRVPRRVEHNATCVEENDALTWNRVLQIQTNGHLVAAVDANGKTLHLFKKVRDGYAQYAGEFENEGDELRPNTPDGDGNLRTAIAFRLRPKAPGAGPAVPPEVADAVDAVSGIARGQGFSQRLTAKDRKAIELRAMEVVTEHFAGLGFDVTDVSDSQPYDLRCRNGGEQVDVEVKGTTTSGETVLLTPNEVQHALTTYPRTALAVVHGIHLRDAGSAAPHATGGTLAVHQPWRPLDIDLKPLGYTYTVP